MSIIELIQRDKEIVIDVDGFYYFWPEGYNKGHFSSHHLREIADHLDKINAPWNAIIEKEIGKE